MFKTLIISAFVLLFSFVGRSEKPISIKKGNWNANLQLNGAILPFKLQIHKVNKSLIFTIHNAEEKINLTAPKFVKDSFQIDFPHFHSYIRFSIKSSKEINGFWYNLNKANNYKIPFFATIDKLKETCKNKSSFDLSGKWKSTFSPNTKDEELAIGLFKKDNQMDEKITGTFLTETGDYRFLEGKTCNNEFYLSCFDGSHAFLFTGSLTQNAIKGVFYSGKHYQTNWIAEKNEVFELKNPDSLTYLVKKDAFSFKLKTLENVDFEFPNSNYTNKVTILQIMGTWCPNCLDETKFLKEMYEKYHNEGLEIISVAYETPTNFEEQVQKVKMLKTRLNLSYTFLIGGQANKSLASEHFSMLNKIISFPTAVFINRKGEVTKIHTGFNGPGTGEIYTNFKLETEKYIQELLNK